MNENQLNLINDPKKFQFLARDIWRENGTKQEYANWWRDSCRKLALKNEIDFLTKNVKNPSGGRPSIEHYLTAKAADILRTHSTPNGVQHTAVKHDALQSISAIIQSGRVPTLVESLEGWLATAKQLEAMQPKADFYDRFADTNQLYTIRDVAKIIGRSERKFIDELIEKRILFRDAKKDLKPYSDIVDSGRMVVKVGESNGHSYCHAKFTAVGIEWIAQKYGIK